MKSIATFLFKLASGRILLGLVSLVFCYCTCVGVYAEEVTYYLLLWHDNNNPSSCGDPVGSVTAENTFSWNVGTLQKTPTVNNYYLTISESESYEDMITDNNIDGSGLVSTFLQDRAKQDYGVAYHFYRFNLSQVKENVTITYDRTDKTFTFTAGCSNTAPSVENGNAVVSGSSVTVESSNVTSAGTNSDCSTPTVTARGVQFTTNKSQSPMPSYSPSVTTGTGEFDTEITGLVLSEGTYYYRTYATNQHGTTYGAWKELNYVPVVNRPVVRIGKRIKQHASNGNVRISGHIAKRGCSDVTSVTINYANNSAFRSDGDYKSYTVTKSISDVTTINSLTDDVYLTAKEVANVINSGEKLFVRIKVSNKSGAQSYYSDVASILYNYDQFLVQDVTIDNATACEGGHEFSLKDMFTPLPYRVVVTSGNPNDFKMESDGYTMTWILDGKETGRPYVYEFTAYNEAGDVSASANLNILDYTATPTTSVTGAIKVNGSVPTEAVSATPYQKLTLSADYSKEEGEDVVWSVVPASAIMNKVSDDGSTSTVSFQGENALKYTVSVRVVNASCGDSESKSQLIVVNRDQDCDE